MKNTATEKKSLKGICAFCTGEIEKSKMTQHLKYCKSRASAISVAEASIKDTGEAEKTKFFHISAEGRYNPQYWMHIELSATAVLEDLDFFFRDTWVECCDHLSAFQVGDISYSDDPEDFYFGEEGEGEEDIDEEEEGEEAGNAINLEDLPPQLVDAMTPELLLKLKEFSTTEDMVAFLKEEQKTFPKDLLFRAP